MALILTTCAGATASTGFLFQPWPLVVCCDQSAKLQMKEQSLQEAKDYQQDE